MMNYLIVLGFGLLLSSCSTQDKAYFRDHPKALQEAINQCPAKTPKLVSCETLHDLALNVNAFVYELRMSPQGFGKSILSLENTIAEQQQQVKNPEVQAALIQNKIELNQRLAIVGWLESPEGR